MANKYIMIVIQNRTIILIAEVEDGAAGAEGQIIPGAAIRAAAMREVAVKAYLRNGHVADQILRFARKYRKLIYQ